MTSRPTFKWTPNQTQNEHFQMDTHNKYNLCIHTSPKNKLTLKVQRCFPVDKGDLIFILCLVLGIGPIEEPWCNSSVEATALSTDKPTGVD